MSRILIFALLFAILGSCKQQDNKLMDPALVSLEEEFNKNLNEGNYDKLITKYLELIHTNLPDKKLKEELLKRAVDASGKMNKTSQQIIFLNNLIKEYPDRAENKEDLYKLIGLLRQGGKNPAADVISLCYLKVYPNDPKANEIKALMPNAVSPDEYILEIGKSIFSDSTKGFDEANAMLYVDACEAYAISMPNDEQTPEYIFKAAETANTLKTFEKSFALYDWIIDRYSSHKRGPMALFMKAFVFDGTLRDSANARKYYNEFINKYPNHEFVKDAKLLLRNVGKSDEDVLKELMQKGGQQ